MPGRRPKAPRGGTGPSHLRRNDQPIKIARSARDEGPRFRQESGPSMFHPRRTGLDLVRSSEIGDHTLGQVYWHATPAASRMLSRCALGLEGDMTFTSTATAARPADRVIDRLERDGYGPRPCGTRQWRSRCPAHGGDSPCLSITEADDGRVLLHCNGHDCKTRDIVQVLDLAMTDLFATADTLPEAPSPGQAQGGTATARSIGARKRSSRQPSSNWASRPGAGSIASRGRTS